MHRIALHFPFRSRANLPFDCVANAELLMSQYLFYAQARVELWEHVRLSEVLLDPKTVFII